MAQRSRAPGGERASHPPLCARKTTAQNAPAGPASHGCVPRHLTPSEGALQETTSRTESARGGEEGGSESCESSMVKAHSNCVHFSKIRQYIVTPCAYLIIIASVGGPFTKRWQETPRYEPIEVVQCSTSSWFCRHKQHHGFVPVLLGLAVQTCCSITRGT